jgi:hypothetical protein
MLVGWSYYMNDKTRGHMEETELNKKIDNVAQLE